MATNFTVPAFVVSSVPRPRSVASAISTSAPGHGSPAGAADAHLLASPSPPRRPPPPCLDPRSVDPKHQPPPPSPPPCGCWQNELDLLSRVTHPNIVSLLGFYVHEMNHYIVYELMEKGSLESQLHGPSHGSTMNWHIRMKITLDTDLYHELPAFDRFKQDYHCKLEEEKISVAFERDSKTRIEEPKEACT
ncbi:hypothetical protein GUJ93_ZPchr0005g14402 [Zizania palustris]|uniref:Serine-threonine/tyrosine-protein kinase catalytic domain-containing protein n=1 Tax=Zizania palustris TaxID=103762 RepID=A0A8J5W206_ZIZPA|nr:hypothetical protein GUJ93_ZPchr0005g14402 [Zizania palustris]